MGKLKNKSPITNQNLDTYITPDQQEIQAAKERAETAFAQWKQKSIQERTKYLTKIREVIIKDLEDIVDRIVEDTGKAEVEALMTDILASLDLIKYYEQNAEDILAVEKRTTPLIFWRNQSFVKYEPLGVVAVIAPWNFPLQLALVPTISAIAAGNTVLLKPSEVTPGVGEIMETIFSQAGLPDNVVQILQGGAEVGQVLIDTQPDKIFFTGSAATGRKIMNQAADNLIPVELELGGKDPMIVLKDADLERAVEAAVYGAFSNSGQLCVSVERLYVAEEIYEEFVEAVVNRTNELRIGQGKDVDLGTITYPQQLEVIKEQVTEAQEKGAQLLMDWKQDGFYLHPLVLTDVNHEMKVMTEETFGPTLPVMPISSPQEAVRLANDTEYGLNASVWSQDIEQAEQLADQLEVGNCYINDVVKNIGNPHLPFGGVKQSGIGRYHGPEGLYSFSQQKSIMISRSQRKELNWFPYSEKLYYLVRALVEVRYSTRGLLDKLTQLKNLYKKFKAKLKQ